MHSRNTAQKQAALMLVCVLLIAGFAATAYAAEPGAFGPVIDAINSAVKQFAAPKTAEPASQQAQQTPKQVVPASAIVAPSENLFQNVLDAINNSAASTAGGAQIPAATATGELSYVSITLAEKADRALLVETYPLPKVIEIDVSSEKPVVKKEVEIVNPALPYLKDYENTPEGLPIATVSGQLQQNAAVFPLQQEDVALLQPAKIEIDIDASGKIAGLKVGEMLLHTLRLEYGPHFGTTEEIELRVYNDACRQKVSANGIALDDDAFAKTPAAYQIEAYRTLGECYAGRAQAALQESEKNSGEAKQSLDAFLGGNITAASQKTEVEKKKATARTWEFASFPELYNETNCPKANAGAGLKDFSAGEFVAMASLRDYYGKNCEAANNYTEAKTYISKAFDAYVKVIEKFPGSVESTGALYAYADAASLLQQAEALRYSHLSFLEATEVMHLSAQQDYFELFTGNLIGVRTAQEAETISAENAKVKSAESELRAAEQATDAQFKNVLSVFDNSSKFFTSARNAASLKKHADYLKTVFGEKKKIVEIQHALEESPNDWSTQDRLLAQEQAYMQVLINSNPNPSVGDEKRAADLDAAKQEIGQKRIVFARSNFLVDIEQEIQELQQFVAITDEGIEKHFSPAYYLYYPTAVGGLISGEVEGSVIEKKDTVGEAKDQIYALGIVKQSLEEGGDITALKLENVPKLNAIKKLNGIVLSQNRMPNEQELAEAYFAEAQHYLNKGIDGKAIADTRARLEKPLIRVAKASYRNVAERFCGKVEEDREDDEEKITVAENCDEAGYGKRAADEYNNIEMPVPVYDKLAPWFGTRETLVAAVSFEYLFVPVGRAVLVPAFAKLASNRLAGFTAWFVQQNAKKVGQVAKRFVSKIPYIESFGKVVVGARAAVVNIVVLPKAVERAVLEDIAQRYPSAAGAAKLLGKELKDILPKINILTQGVVAKELPRGGSMSTAECAAGCEALVTDAKGAVNITEAAQPKAVIRQPSAGATEEITVRNMGGVREVTFGSRQTAELCGLLAAATVALSEDEGSTKNKVLFFAESTYNDVVYFEAARCLRARSVIVSDPMASGASGWENVGGTLRREITIAEIAKLDPTAAKAINEGRLTVLPIDFAPAIRGMRVSASKEINPAVVMGLELDPQGTLIVLYPARSNIVPTIRLSRAVGSVDILIPGGQKAPMTTVKVGKNIFYAPIENTGRLIGTFDAVGTKTGSMRSTFEAMAEKATQNVGSTTVSAGLKNPTFGGINSAGDTTLFVRVASDEATAKTATAQVLRNAIDEGVNQGMRINSITIGGREWTRSEILSMAKPIEGSETPLYLSDEITKGAEVDWLVNSATPAGKTTLTPVKMRLASYSADPVTGKISFITNEKDAATEYLTSYFTSKADAEVAAGLGENIPNMTASAISNLENEAKALWGEGRRFEAAEKISQLIGITHETQRVEALNAFQSLGIKPDYFPYEFSQDIVAGTPGNVYGVYTEVDAIMAAIEKKQLGIGGISANELTETVKGIPNRVAGAEFINKARVSEAAQSAADLLSSGRYAEARVPLAQLRLEIGNSVNNSVGNAVTTNSDFAYIRKVLGGQ